MHVSKAIMALLMAANPKNLMGNTQGKSATDYWEDFILYLRLGLETTNYEKWRDAASKNQPPIHQNCIRLIHRMCHALFLRIRARQEDLSLIHHVMGKDLEGAMWASLAEAEEKLVQELHNYPSGPLMKVLQMFREQKDKEGFDPILQDNMPGQIFTLTTEELHTTIIHMPVPVHQMTLDKGEITPEFRSYLHSLGERKHLYVNLQNRLSGKEQFRCKLLEEVAEKGEFSHHFYLLSLSKDSHFYHQIEEYSKLEDAKAFCKLCVEQILGGTEHGFYFPTGKTPKTWLEPLVKFIHTHFFAGLEYLNRKQRLDFIEILYFFIILHYVDHEKPDVLNFSCKDGIDTGAAAAASFYGFTRMLSSSSHWTSHDRDAFLFTLFLPALFIRHRSIETSRFQRTLSALEHFEAILKEHRDEVLKGCAKLLPEIPLKDLKISDVA